jgi:predicted metalloprotease with PDZ domain
MPRHRSLPLLLAAAVITGPVLGTPVPGLAASGQPPCEWDAEACVKYMIQSFENKGWIGIELDFSEAESPRVTRVLEGSPAAAAGLVAGDVLVALDGVAYATASEEELKEAKKAMVPGRQVRLTVRRGGDELILPVTLGTIPQSVLAQWIGTHLIEAHAHQFASSESIEAGNGDQ